MRLPPAVRKPGVKCYVLRIDCALAERHRPPTAARKTGVVLCSFSEWPRANHAAGGRDGTDESANVLRGPGRNRTRAASLLRACRLGRLGRFSPYARPCPSLGLILLSFSFLAQQRTLGKKRPKRPMRRCSRHRRVSFSPTFPASRTGVARQRRRIGRATRSRDRSPCLDSGGCE